MLPTDILTTNAILQHKTPFPKPINFNDDDWAAWDYLQEYPNSYQSFVIKPIRKIQQCACYTCNTEFWIFEQFVRNKSVVFCSCNCAGAASIPLFWAALGEQKRYEDNWTMCCRECNLK